jgi:Ser/Thr protein kinase RdoA (MazF antagonist)
MLAPIPEILDRYPAALAPRGTPQSLGNAGGSSGAELWRFSSGRGELVLRAWPVDGPSRATIERIHGWLRHAKALAFLAPPLADRQGRTLQEGRGRFWEVSRWLPGVAPTDRLPTRGQIRAAFVGLALLHQALACESSRGPSPNLVERLREVEALRAGGVAGLAEVVRSARDDPARVPALRWLELAGALVADVHDELRREASRTLDVQPCLRDARAGHFLFEGETLTGLVDYGAMGVDCVATDLARLLADWADDDPLTRRDALRAYGKVRPLSADEDCLIDVYRRSAALLGGGRWVRWHFVEGRHFERPEMVSEGITRSVDRLARWATGRVIR